ncbi:MAG: hypothetical protein KIT31_21900 [Deltaproteobacteria bacterium]|nr:hypothetical protein [Deltaproteobacteria bacterium]
MKKLALLTVVLASHAYADTPDLTVHELPAPGAAKDMKMRDKRAAAKKQVADEKAAKKVVAAADDASSSGSTSTSFKPIPTSMRDLRERVIFRINAGVQLDNAPASGDALRGGAQLPGDFAGSRAWLVGDAVVGAHDILLPSMGAYFLTSFQLDTTDSLATRTATISPFDSSDLALAIKAGYAEYGRDDRKPDATGVWLRGGRQFRLDGGNLFAYFDGATIGYRAKGVQVSGFAGQRVALYIDTQRGVTYGGTITVDLKAMKTAPAKISVDYQGLAIDVFGEGQARSLLALNGSYALGTKGKVDIVGRLVDAGDGTGFGLGRVGGRLRYQLSNDMLVIADATQKLGGDLAYDLSAPTAGDVLNIAQRLGVGLNRPVDALNLGATLDYRKKESEVMVFVRTEQASGTPQFVDQRGYIEGGAALAGSPVGSRGAGVWATLQYRYRQFLNGGHDDDQMGSAFGDSSTSGIDQMHEISADATLRSGGRGSRRWRFQAGAFYRIYDFSSPYREVTTEGRGGGRADLQFWMSRDLRLQVGAEGAEASVVLSPDIGFMTSVRAALEARW